MSLLLRVSSRRLWSFDGRTLTSKSLSKAVS
ncbi:hypothetical protein J3A64_004785 [Pseudarthrobacter sp. PvP004]|nr:hypothetical protein [Pseudarthrobacter sp. PvP004]